ncbi:MAG: Lrp/AsnC family transcriptional regulator [Dehalococcoidia bacterium]
MVSKAAETLEQTDKELLNILQWDFPLVERPFAGIGEKLDISEQGVIDRIARLKREEVIREINAIFDTRRLGYKSSLVAVRAPEDSVDDVAEVISQHPGVSHNYQRNHHFNIWFTLAVPPEEELEEELEKLADRAGAEKYRLLPTKHMFKIGVKLDMTRDEESLEPEARIQKTRTDHGPLSEADKQFIRVLQEDIPLTPRPFDGMADTLGMTREELFRKLEEFQSAGLMRRYAAILRHQNAGFIANGMVCWRVPEERIREVGEIAASFPQVSHCYQRPVYPDWPYSLFSMIHARDEEKCRRIAEKISEKTGVTDYAILFSTKEYKKERVKYFV